MAKRNKKLIESLHDELCKHEAFQKAIHDYIVAHDLTLPDNAQYVPGIDFVDVRVDGFSVLIVGFPTVSNYPISETEYTNKYLKTARQIAVS